MKKWYRVIVGMVIASLMTFGVVAITSNQTAEASSFWFTNSPHSDVRVTVYRGFEGTGHRETVDRGGRAHFTPISSFWLPSNCKAYTPNDIYNWPRRSYGRFINLVWLETRTNLIVDC